jgi:hypothetical protein
MQTCFTKIMQYPLAAVPNVTSHSLSAGQWVSDIISRETSGKIVDRPSRLVLSTIKLVPQYLASAYVVRPVFRHRSDSPRKVDIWTCTHGTTPRTPSECGRLDTVVTLPIAANRN